MKILTLKTLSMIASIALMGPVGSAMAAEEWTMLGEQTIKSVDPSVNINSEGNRWKRDVKWVKLSAEGADVELQKVVLHWDNRRDDTISDLGVLSGGQSWTRKPIGGRRAGVDGLHGRSGQGACGLPPKAAP